MTKKWNLYKIKPQVNVDVMRSKQQRKDYETKISMDGKGRAIDNIYIEQFCRSLKYGYAYLNSSNGGIDLLKRG